MGFLHGDPSSSPFDVTNAKSGDSVLNFLWQADGKPVYVMDNHLAALWCWLRELDPEDEYSLIHIDQHWDSRPCNDVASIQAAEARAGARRLAIGEFLDLSCVLSGELYKVVQWDNYIRPLPSLRAHARQAHCHAYDPRGAAPQLQFAEPTKIYATPEEFFRLLPALVEYLPGRPLINLDLDYFFLPLGGSPTKAFRDDFIANVVTEIERNLETSAVWTIAWSPECCGSLPSGWQAAADTCKVVCGALGLKCPAEKLGLANL
jgi:hypothetical protein